MVLKKRIYYGGFHGLLAPVIPKAPRSLRRKSLHSKSSEGGEICAFELLAAVAGKLLQESESSTSSIGSEGKEQISIPKELIKHEPLEVKVQPVKSEHHDQGSCSEREHAAQPTNLELKLEPHLKELPQSDNESGLERTSIVTTDFIKKDGTNSRPGASEDKNGSGEIPSKPEGGSPNYGKLCDVNLDDNRVEIQTEATEKRGGVLTAVKPYSLKDQVANNLANSVHLSFYKDPVPSAGFPRHRGNVKIDIRDDDEKYFRYSHRNTRRRAFGSRSHAGYRRIRKMLTSRYRKVAPKLKDYELSNTISGGVRSFYHKRKNLYMREQHQEDAASKRRKLFQSKRAYIKEASSESISNSPEKGGSGEKRRPAAALKRGMTSSVISRKGAFPSKDSHVKFSIKSFKVPELYVEVPETATVGSLKRSVMEAVTAILQSKLHVGVLLQGKKVRDDSRTLQQTGISQNCNLETLGFTLEPALPEASPSLILKETPLLLPCNAHEQPSRSPSSPTIDMGFSDSSLDPPPPVTMDNLLEKNEESITYSAEVSTEEREADSKALVLVPALDAEVLSMVPLSEKPTKRYELSQRRTRRPFSVSEVEALVEAVETLGAGRWRDVKMRAFDDANHRTYVDLKDKWKTLVHTASISPQQRRGEPVPQDLLDRVLAAHAYWSQHQSKQNAKHQKTMEAPL